MALARTLILDDDPVFAALAEAVLLSAGCESVRIVGGGEQEFREAVGDARPPELIILDLNMPDFDGLAALRVLGEAGFAGRVTIASGETAAVLRSAAQLAALFGLKLTDPLSKPLRQGEIEALLAKLDSAEDAPVPPRPAARFSAFKTLVPVFQPKINSLDGSLYGAEALMRVMLEDGRLTSPQEHIESLVSAGKLGEASRLFLDKVIEEMKQWGKEFAPRISLNLPAPLLENAKLMAGIIKTIKVSGLPPTQFTIELTEAALPSDLPLLLEIMTRIRIAGIGLALDDYGTGMANYDILRLCPFSELKIDRSVAQAVVHDRLATNFVDNAVMLARELDMQLVAEGVETQEQVDALRKLGVRVFQGYFFNKPLTSNEFLTLHS